MFDVNTLSQLKDLKKQIEDAKEFATGIVKGTERRFGFVVLDDEREIFLAPEEMDKVFPGDKVKIQVHTSAEGKVSGELIKLINSPLKTFTGRYVVKGKGHFVEPDLPRFKRWIFIPPAARNNAQNGDYIHCAISRHAYPAAKPQAKVLAVIGNDDSPGIEAEYSLYKFQLEQPLPADWQASLQDVDLSQRVDLSALNFVTIDAPSTQDMDDALYIEAKEQGWQLSVAIADPSAYISENSVLDKEAQRRASSVYMPGRTVTMLPEQLSLEHCSLHPEQNRAALVCRMDISPEGQISDYQILEASICSKAKLSYYEVASYLDGEASEHPQAELLGLLQQASNALLAHRQQAHLVSSGRPEFRIRLNEQGKIDSIEPSTKTSAHLLVEECMVAANSCAADFMAEQGLFHGHVGFRPERLEGVKKLIDEQLGLSDLDLASVAGYRQLSNSIEDDKLSFPVRSVLSRMLERGRLYTRPTPHFGMGMERYTTFTSPIRKYSDLLVHRIIKAKLAGKTLALKEQDLSALQDSLDRARQARWHMEQWLKCQYLHAFKGQELSGSVCQINSNGFTVRLDNTGIEGIVDTRKLKEKYSFDPLRLRLSSKDVVIELDQAVTVTIAQLDVKQRSIQFALVNKASEAEAKTEPEAKPTAD
ncbi:VacB/RNase II family 3'-5' exoribonuclease [Dasania sp. GY-MA-18]|uniref:exoribonuclease II n=1 Tax=Dasania phycosphaerae TaxID=2950436 RepID=A0A9J6RJK4_9GAMM|nr:MULTISPECIES: VacB/RNase II family 3'-5' exoribonuclease [Dasania]MCR8922434.1 VacB/RNase II family 3'-5' exoribonuclease [Dasania sp. GY-MA-18]MCZ0864862.1 VacB/RNase II family 3'-5' exoribonuclease [Dasania phycosphaerae]MCZ0868590.1 VacB/RNase II family 3'-5' exoribonuclease [Dasania phycosphaerae]